MSQRHYHLYFSKMKILVPLFLECGGHYITKYILTQYLIKISKIWYAFSTFFVLFVNTVFVMQNISYLQYRKSLCCHCPWTSTELLTRVNFKYLICPFFTLFEIQILYGFPLNVGDQCTAKMFYWNICIRYLSLQQELNSLRPYCQLWK